MSNASAMLEAGRLALVAQHGETLTWLPASAVQKSESGEVVIGNNGKAIIIDELIEPQEFTATFDEAFQVINAYDGSIASTGPAVLDVKIGELNGVGRGDLIYRNGVQYFVMGPPQSDGVVGLILILSKHAH